MILLTQLWEKYGDVFAVYLGSWPVIILCGYKMRKEALVDQAETFSGRGYIAIVDPIFQVTDEWGWVGPGERTREYAMHPKIFCFRQ